MTSQLTHYGQMDQHNLKKSLVFVESPEVLQDLIQSLPYDPHSSSHLQTPSQHLYSRSVRSSSHSHSDSGFHMKSTSKLQKKLINEQLRLQHLKVMSDTQKNVERAIKKNAENKLKRIVVLEKSIQSCQTFLNTIDARNLTNNETLANKRRHQYDDWNKDVFGSIQHRLMSAVNAMDSKELNRIKNEDYQKYLDITNRKSAIFRDTIIEGEYDPLEVNRRSHVIRMPLLKDPTNTYQQKMEAEAAMLDVDHKLPLGGSSKKGGGSSYGKFTLPAELWAAGRLEATPYGGERERKVAQGGERGNSSGMGTLNSHIVFDHFQIPVGKSAMDAELPRGKRPGRGCSATDAFAATTIF